MNFLLTSIFVFAFLLILHLIGLVISRIYTKKYSYINIDGYNIHYKRTGAGPNKIILIHGMFSNLHCWDKLTKLSNPNTEYICLDLPQMAESQTTNKKTPTETIQDIIFKFSKELKLENPAIMGCSLGGLVAYLSYQKYSDYFKKCIIVASPFRSKILILPVYKFNYLAKILNLLVNPIIVFTTHRRITGGSFSLSQSWIIFSKFRNPQHFKASMDYTCLIPSAESKIDIHTKVENYHFIWGTKDHLVKKKDFINFISRNKQLSYTEIPKASHHPMESHPNEFLMVLSKILNS